MEPINKTIEYWPIERLIRNARNARTHSDGSATGSAPATLLTKRLPGRDKRRLGPGRPHVFAPKWQTRPSLPRLAIPEKPVLWPFLMPFWVPLTWLTAFRSAYLGPLTGQSFRRAAYKSSKHKGLGPVK